MREPEKTLPATLVKGDKFYYMTGLENPLKIRISKIKQLFSDEINNALNIYYSIKANANMHYGLPFGAGWMKQPAVIWDIVEALDMEQGKRARFDREQRGR